MRWFRILWVKLVGGILGIGLGLSLGREGPSIQIGAVTAQGLSRTLGRTRMEERYLITAGASAGLAAAFNAPLAGVIFALEELHRNFSGAVLAPSMAAALMATIVSRVVFGHGAVFQFGDLPIFAIRYMPDPTGYGRIIRDDQGQVLKIVEQKDGTPEELAVAEVNAGIYCFDSTLLWKLLHTVTNDNAQGEYYLTDIIGMKTDLDPISYAKVDTKDLFEIRLILEPEAAYLAAKRGTDVEIQQIAELCDIIAGKIRNHEDRTRDEHLFHSAIAQATHNKFMNNMIPILHRAIMKGVVLSNVYGKAAEETLIDHSIVVDFLKERNAEGARDAMRIHILHDLYRQGRYGPVRYDLQCQYAVGTAPDASPVHAVGRLAHSYRCQRPTVRYLQGRPRAYRPGHRYPPGCIESCR